MKKINLEKAVLFLLRKYNRESYLSMYRGLTIPGNEQKLEDHLDMILENNDLYEKEGD